MDDEEIEIVCGAWSATIAPYGAGVRALRFGGMDVMTAYSGRAAKVGSQGDVLIPFPGRVGGATYVFGGERHVMTRNDKDGPNAIHGFLRTADWDVVDEQDDQVTLATVIDSPPGYPFGLLVAVNYRLDEDGFTCEFGVTNAGEHNAPVAAGFHPYFTAGGLNIDADTLTLPFSSALEMQNLIPTGKIQSVAEAGLDFRTPATIGERKFNHCFANPARDPDGKVRIVLAGESQTVTVWMDEAFDYVVLYSGDPLPESHRRKSLAIEPMTCGSDAFNHPDWGLVTLAPDEQLTGLWGVGVERR